MSVGLAPKPPVAMYDRPRLQLVFGYGHAANGVFAHEEAVHPAAEREVHILIATTLIEDVDQVLPSALGYVGAAYELRAPLFDVG